MDYDFHFTQSVADDVEPPLNPFKTISPDDGRELERVHCIAQLSKIIEKLVGVVVEWMIPRQHVYGGGVGIKGIKMGFNKGSNRLEPWIRDDLKIGDSSLQLSEGNIRLFD